ncbi:MAG TPA: hypothetical protein VI685_06435 [Candidatus Angelobacter sp.]
MLVLTISVDQRESVANESAMCQTNNVGSHGFQITAITGVPGHARLLRGGVEVTGSRAITAIDDLFPVPC